MNSTDHFEAIVNEHYQALYRFALSLTRSESDAMDLTQHTFLVWATKGNQLHDLSKVKTWLYTTLHRAFLQGRRRQIRMPHQDMDKAVEQLPAVSPVLSDCVDSSQVLPALAKVDEVYQAAVALFYLEDYAYKDIAVILDVPIGTVKSRIARGIAQLREILLPDTRIPAPKRENGTQVPVSPWNHATSSESHFLPRPCLTVATTNKTKKT